MAHRVVLRHNSCFTLNAFAYRVALANNVADGAHRSRCLRPERKREETMGN